MPARAIHLNNTVTPTEVMRTLVSEFPDLNIQNSATLLQIKSQLRKVVICKGGTLSHTRKVTALIIHIK